VSSSPIVRFFEVATAGFRLQALFSAPAYRRIEKG
jgi:hypothetical protein